MQFLVMEKKKRIHYNTTLDANLLKQIKYLAIEENKRHNDLLEEAIRDLLKKYQKKSKKWFQTYENWILSRKRY